MLEARVYNTLQSIPETEWKHCFPSQIEDYNYFRAIEDANLTDFSWRYVTIWEDNRLCAAAPFFLTDYDLTTTLQGKIKSLLSTLKKIWPRVFNMRMACLGSPCTETGYIGIADHIYEFDKIYNLLRLLFINFENYAAANYCKLTAIKDIVPAVQNLFGHLIYEKKYQFMPGLPIAWLKTDFKTIDEYLGRLSYSMRKNMRRKLKSFETVRVETRSDIADVIEMIMDLYNDTWNRSDWKFEKLTAEYFINVLKNLPGRSFCNLYYVDDKLLAMNLLIHDEDTLVDKFFCMDGVRGRFYNLYYLSWFQNIQYCLDHGFSVYQSGQSYYDNKIKLGSQLTQNAMYFKHGSKIAQYILQLLSPWLSADADMVEAD